MATLGKFSVSVNMLTLGLPPLPLCPSLPKTHWTMSVNPGPPYLAMHTIETRMV